MSGTGSKGFSHSLGQSATPTFATGMEEDASIPDANEAHGGCPCVERIPGYEASSWYGVGAPRNAPVENGLNKETNAGLADRKMVARFAELGLTVVPGSPVDFDNFIRSETVKRAKVVKASGARAD